MNEYTTADATYKKWQSWFAGVNEQQLYFEKWLALTDSCRRLKTGLSNSGLPLKSANEALDRAGQKLDYESPYRLVVVGETGAGKSTLINAILGRKLLETGAGGAITGAAAAVHLDPELEQPKVFVEYRTSEQFLSMVAKMLSRFGIDPPSSMEELQEAVELNRLTPLLEAKGGPEVSRKQLLKDMTEIIRVWAQLKSNNRLGAREELDLERDCDKLKSLLSEPIRADPTGSAKQLVAGVALAEYYIPTFRFNAQAERSFNAVLIDTPGLGARTFRHREVLQEQVEKADAVILVIGARRPEGQNTSLTDLFNETLFKGYTPEERSRFASKVFLVVNHINIIQSDDDRARLNESLNEIASVIADNYFQLFGENSRDRRYFEMDEQLTLFAEGIDPAQVADPSSSQLLELFNKVRDFLSHQRIKLMLAEADTHLRRAVSLARADCEAVLRANGIETGELNQPRVMQLRHHQQLCSIQLDRDKELIEQAYSRVLASFEAWRKSSGYEQRLLEQCHLTRANLEQALRACTLSMLLKNSVAYDDITGKHYREAPVRALLLQVEREMRNAAETEAKRLAQFYISEFVTQITRHQIISLVEEKTYGQDYVLKNLNTVKSLILMLQQIQQVYMAACGGVLMYELIQRPILNSSVVSESRAPEVAKKIGAALEGLMAASVVRSNPAAAHSSRAGEAPAASTDAASATRTEARVRILPPQPIAVISTERDDPSDEEVLVAYIDRMIRQDKTQEKELQDLIIHPFIGRYQSALAVALPQIENLFFYQVSKFRLRFAEVVEELRTEHLAQARANPSSAIAAILIEQQQGAKKEIDKALHVLELIHQSDDRSLIDEAA